MSITTDIRDFALDIGYSKVGITSADSFKDHIDEVLSRRPNRHTRRCG
jgi:epoxyqueuosine reductase